MFFGALESSMPVRRQRWEHVEEEAAREHVEEEAEWEGEVVGGVGGPEGSDLRERAHAFQKLSCADLQKMLHFVVLEPINAVFEL